MDTRDGDGVERAPLARSSTHSTPKRGRGPSFKPHEDRAIAEAWLCISSDPALGVYQKGSIFQSKVEINVQITMNSRLIRLQVKEEAIRILSESGSAPDAVKALSERTPSSIHARFLR
jgi:hypothetical protein